MQRWSVMGMGALLFGCAVAAPSISTSPLPSSPAMASPSVPVPSPSGTMTPMSPSMGGFTGLWAFGEGPQAEPPAGEVSGCSSTVSLMQQGDRLELTNSQYCGAPGETVSGVFSGNHVRLEGVRYRGRLTLVSSWELEFHPETGHFTGTDNGQPVWLARGHSCPSTSVFCDLSVQGQLYNQLRQPISDAATVTLKSLNPSAPYESSVQAVNGHYAFIGVPARIQLSITAEVEGQPPVTRTETAERGPVWDVNFGGPIDPIDPDGWRYWAKAVPSPSPLPSAPGPTAVPSGF